MHLHETLTKTYEPQHRLFGRLIRLCFSFAGCFWILIYGMQWLALIDHDALRDLRSGQTMIYFILLSLWGIEYLRETSKSNVCQRNLSAGKHSSPLLSVAQSFLDEQPP